IRVLIVTGVQTCALPIYLLDRARVVGDEGIHADDGVAELQQALTQVRADEAGGAGDQASHALPPGEVRFFPRFRVRRRSSRARQIGRASCRERVENYMET